MRRRWTIALACSLTLAACKASSPDVDDPGLDGFDAGGVFADTIVAYGDSAAPTSCTSVVPECSELPADCGPQEVLGAPDGATYTLPANGRIEVAFRCAQITEKGASSPDEITYDFQVLATVDTGAQAIVEVSFDGSEFATLQELHETDQVFDLSWTEMNVVRFVRISDTGGGGIAIDAVSAL